MTCFFLLLFLSGRSTAAGVECSCEGFTPCLWFERFRIPCNMGSSCGLGRFDLFGSCSFRGYPGRSRMRPPKSEEEPDNRWVPSISHRDRGRARGVGCGAGGAWASQGPSAGERHGGFSFSRGAWRVAKVCLGKGFGRGMQGEPWRILFEGF